MENTNDIQYNDNLPNSWTCSYCKARSKLKVSYREEMEFYFNHQDIQRGCPECGKVHTFKYKPLPVKTENQIIFERLKEHVIKYDQKQADLKYIWSLMGDKK